VRPDFQLNVTSPSRENPRAGRGRLGWAKARRIRAKEAKRFFAVAPFWLREKYLHEISDANVYQLPSTFLHEAGVF